MVGLWYALEKNVFMNINYGKDGFAYTMHNTVLLHEQT